jgi:hypothetical protein
LTKDRNRKRKITKMVQRSVGRGDVPCKKVLLARRRITNKNAIVFH